MIAAGGRAERVRATMASVVVAGLVVLGLGACEPAPPPDGRDLVLDTSAIPRNATVGTSVTFSVEVGNVGTATADEVRFTYAAQSGITVDAVAPAGGPNCPETVPGGAACDVGDLAPGETRTFDVTVSAGPVLGPVQQLVAATSAGSEGSPDPNPNAVVATTTLRPEPSLPVNAGISSDANFLGTGDLLANGSPFPAEGITLATAAYCTDKANGDRYQSAYVGGVCTGVLNPEYSTAGYTYELDVPAGRTHSIGIWVWDASYNKTCTGVLSGSTCTNDPTPPPDSFLTNSQPYTEPFTFSVYAADSTPLNSNDNPLLCQRTFTADSPFELTFLGSSRWHSLCTVSTSAPSGTYYLRVRNAGAPADPKANGPNRFGLVAANLGPSMDPAAVLCSRLSDPTCPTWSAASTTPVMVTTSGPVTRFPLHPIPASQVGRVLHLEIWDPGEGVETIRILRPSGPASWAPASFAWTSPGLVGSSSTTSLDVSQARFNGRLVTITIDLDGYAPDPANDRWLVEYATGAQVVHDVATWTAWVGDAPVPG